MGKSGEKKGTNVWENQVSMEVCSWDLRGETQPRDFPAMFDCRSVGVGHY